MKTTIDIMRRSVGLLAVAIASLSPSLANAQVPEEAATGNEIRFTPVLKEDSGLKSEAAEELLLSKLEQILARCEAAGGKDSPFQVCASVNVGEVQQTEGLVQNVAAVGGELVLQARNGVNGSLCGGTVIPLKATVKGADKDIEKALVASIKITDPKFVRFVRNTRKTIQEMFSVNCATVIAEARKLGTAGKTAEAVEYLMGIPSDASCYEEALGYIALYAAPAPESVPDNVPDNVPVEEPLVPDSVEGGSEPAPVPEPEPVAAQAPEPAPAAPAPVPAAEPVPAQGVQPQITVSEPGLKVRILSCGYNPGNRRIDLSCMIEAEQGTNGTVLVNMEQAVGPEGEGYEKLGVDGTRYIDFPAGVGIRKTFYIADVAANPGTLPFVKIKVSNWRVEIRNLEVK